MYCNDEREWALRQVGNGHWTWLVTLHYPHQSQFHRPEWSETLFKMLIAEISAIHGCGSCISYIRATERRDTGEVLFHVLLDGVPARARSNWKVRWKELSGGTACDSPLGDGEMRFEQLVRELHCDIEAIIGWNAAVWPAGKNC